MVYEIPSKISCPLTFAWYVFSKKKGQYAHKLENWILVLIKQSASSVNASNVSPNTWYVVSLHFKLLMVQKPNRTHHCYSSVVACGASEKRRAASGTFARTIQAQSKPIQTTFTYKPNRTKLFSSPSLFPPDQSSTSWNPNWYNRLQTRPWAAWLALPHH